MISHNGRWIRLSAASISGVVIVAGALSGCGGEPEATNKPREVVRASAPPPPPAPAIISVAQLMMDLRIDERIVMMEEDAPKTTAERKAVLEFFDGFARGDVETLGSMMSLVDRLELESLVESGIWDEAIAGITEISVEAGVSPSGDKCTLALFEVHDDYQPQLWYYHSGSDGFMFDAAPTPPDIMDKLYGDDFIKRWHEILEEELAMADKPDEDFEKPKAEEEEDDDKGSSSGTSLGGGSGGRSNKPKGPGRRTPPKKKRRPPGPGGR